MCNDMSNLGCETDENQEGDYSTNLASHIAVPVDLEYLNITDLKKKRFARALKFLDLRPHLHRVQALPSQESIRLGGNELVQSMTCQRDFDETKKAELKAKIEESVKSKFVR
jgi:hypothetical protein